MPWRTLARLVASSQESIEIQVPGGWEPVRVDIGSVPQWLRDTPVGEHVDCTAELGPNDTVVVTSWHRRLAIGLDPHPFTLDDYEAVPEAKLELIGGILLGDVASRDAVVAALLRNVGLAEVVRMASRELWLQALEARSTAAT